MSRFEFLNAPDMNEFDELSERESIIDGFLLEKSINIVWGRSGLGKTWLCFGLCKMLANDYDILYLDADNGVDLVKDRGYDKLLRTLPITYINADLFDDSKEGMNKILSDLEANVSKGYEKAVFIFDSLTFFLDGDLYDERKISHILRLFKRLRRAGGTIIVIAHSTKSGNLFRGGSNLQNAVDELWEIQKKPSLPKELNFVCEPFKRRLDVHKTGFNVKTTTCDICIKDIKDLEVKESEVEAIKAIKRELETKDYSQSQLLKALKKPRNDRVYTRVLKRFDGIYWFSEDGKNSSINYSLEKKSKK